MSFHGSGPAPFSFHCIICFEAFNLDDRPPVILPCGHTYVCSPCSKRLDKCMECRQSLFIKPSALGDGSKTGSGSGSGSGSAGTGTGTTSGVEPLGESRAAQAGVLAGDNEPMPSWYRPPPGRVYHDRHRQDFMHQHPPKKPVPPKVPLEPIRLPLPKNLVMMSLMEAAEQKKELDRRAQRVAERKSRKALKEAARSRRAAAAAAAAEGQEEEAATAVTRTAAAAAAPTSLYMALGPSLDEYDVDDEDEAAALTISSTYAPPPPVSMVSITVDDGGFESIEKTDESFRREQQEALEAALRSEEERGEQEHLHDDDDEEEADGGTQYGGGDRKRKGDNLLSEDDDGVSSTSDSFDDDDDDQSDDESSKAYESGDDDSAVRAGMQSLLGTCGTYLVRDAAGLAVLSTHPAAETEEEGGDETSKGGGGGASEEVESNGPLHLKRGQTVQVSYVDEKGIAVLSRGCGFIRANDEQLVKVGAPKDKACRIEGTIRSIELKRRWYQERLAELPLLEKKYTSELDRMVESGGQDLALVIGPPPEGAADSDLKDDENKIQSVNTDISGRTAEEEPGRQQSPKENNPAGAGAAEDFSSHSPRRIPQTNSDHMTPQTPQTPVQQSPVMTESPGNIVNSSPFTIDNSEIGQFVLSTDDMSNSSSNQLHRYQPALTRQDSTSNVVSNFGLGCGFLAGNSYLEGQEEDSLVGLSFDSAIDLDRSSNSGNLSNPRSPERKANRPPEYTRTPERNSSSGVGYGGGSSFDTAESSSTRERVDFRSGYSGHRGLLGAKSHADRMKAEQNRREIRTMGEHRGIASIGSRGGGLHSVPSRGMSSVASRNDRSFRPSRISDAR